MHAVCRRAVRRRTVGGRAGRRQPVARHGAAGLCNGPLTITTLQTAGLLTKTTLTTGLLTEAALAAT
jgi:hypothetical protein